jgi:hypothetical protein
VPALPLSTYERFAEFLGKRIETKQHLTEDSVRYAFFLAVTQTTSIQQHEIILELPHPKFPGKEVDTYIAATAGRSELFVEFKFHRTAKSTSPKPQKAGSLFKDISRLASLTSNDRHCLVVYFTCSEMARYFDKNETSYSQFWKQPTGGAFVYDDSFVAKTTDTFRKASSEHHSARVHVEFSATIMQKYHVRVFDVREI